MVLGMELGPDEVFWQKRLKPPPGCVTMSALANHLKISERKLRAYCIELGIELDPLVRNEPYFRKPRVYKNRYRWITQEEIKRIMELHYSRLNDWDD